MSEQTAPITPDSVGPREPTRVFRLKAFTHLAWLPVPLLMATIIVARIMGLNESHRAETLTLLLGFVFYTLTSLGAIFLVGRSFLATGRPGLLLFECGLVLWSLAGPVGDTFFPDDPNAIVTIFNAGILLAGLCILSGAILSLKPQRSLLARPLFLGVGCGASLIALWLITQATLANWLPVFFVTGQGGTLVRYCVLVAAILAFALSAALLLARSGKKSPFIFWYAMALLSLAVGLFGIMIQLSLGSVVNWLSRSAEWLGGLYLLFAAIASVKESRLSLLPAPDTVQRPAYYRDAVAVALVLAAAALRLTFLPAMGMKAPYVVFYPAVLCATIYGGIRAGLLAVGLSVILADYFWIEPLGQLGIKETADWLGLLIYLLSSGLIVWAAEAMRRATSSAAAAKAQALLSAERESERKRSEAIALRHLAIQNGVNKVLEAALASTTEEELGRVCLDVAEKITESKFGFIGEIGQDGYLHGIAISDTGWELCAMYDKSGAKRPAGTFPIHGLYGRVLTESKSLFTNDPVHHPDSIGVPPGHPALTAFLGVPLTSQGQTIGMIAVANRPGGYSENEQEALGALAPAIVESFERKRAEEDLLESQTKLEAALNSMSDAVFISDAQGRFIDFNDAFSTYHRFRNKEECYKTLAEYQDYIDVYFPDGTLAPFDMWAVPRALRGEMVSDVEYILRRKDTGETWRGSYNFAPIRDGEGNIVGSVITGRDITDRKRAEMDLVQAKEQLAFDLDAMTRLQEIGTLFLQEANLQPVLTEIVAAAIIISGSDFGNIQLLEPETSDLKIVAQQGFPQWWIDFWSTVAKGRGTCGTALERGERVIVEDVEQSPIFVGTSALDIQLRAGLRAVQSTPLVSRSGKPLGMFSTHFKKPHRPDERSLRLLDLLARQASDIIERWQAEEALRKARDELEFRVKERTSELEEAYKDLEMEMAERKQAEETLRQSQKMEAIGHPGGRDRP